MLKVEGLKKIYGTGDAALRGVDLSVGKGQVIGLIGPSGAGKSTLIRCINRLVEPTDGKVFLGNTDVTALGRRDLRRIRRRIGMIFQEFALVERLSVMENALSGRLGYMGFWASWFRRFPADDIQKAFAVLDRVGLMDHVDKRADALSGGQRQRVGIARALIRSRTCCWWTNRRQVSIQRRRGRSCDSSSRSARSAVWQPSSTFTTSDWHRCSCHGSSVCGPAKWCTTARRPVSPRMS